MEVLYWMRDVIYSLVNIDFYMLGVLQILKSEY